MAFLLSNNSLLSRLRSTQHRQQQQVIDVLLLPLSRLFFCSFVFFPVWSNGVEFVFCEYMFSVRWMVRSGLPTARFTLNWVLGRRRLVSRCWSVTQIVFVCLFVCLIVGENLQKSIVFGLIRCSFYVLVLWKYLKLLELSIDLVYDGTKWREIRIFSLFHYLSCTLLIEVWRLGSISFMPCISIIRQIMIFSSVKLRILLGLCVAESLSGWVSKKLEHLGLLSFLCNT